MANQCEVCNSSFDSPFKLAAHSMKKCKSKTCNECGAKFKQNRDLQRHIKNRKDIDCTHCSRTFCSHQHFNQHLRTINEEENNADTSLDQPVQPQTGYEDYEGYKKLVKKKSYDINDWENIRTHKSVVNKKINPGFTYRDLETLILQTYAKKQGAFKIGIGFGFILYNPTNGKFRYYYNSANNMIFEDAAITISERKDVTKLMKRIVNLDLATNFYLKKPSSSWVLAGLPNVEVHTYDLHDIPIGYYLESNATGKFKILLQPSII